MITEHQRETRKNYLGSSDMPAILGLNPWKSAYDVWIEKTYDTETKTSDAIDRGNYLEDGIIEWAAHRLGDVKVMRNQFRVGENGIFSCHLDAKIDNIPQAIEIKTTNNAEYWGHEGNTSDPECFVPEWVYIQCLCQIYAARLDRIHIAVLMPDFNRFAMKMYTVDRNQEVIDQIVEQGESWWNNHIVGGIEPEKNTDSQPSLTLLKTIKRKPGYIKVLGEDALMVIKKWEDAKKAANESDKIKKATEAEALALFGDAEGITLPDNRTLTCLTYQRKGYVVNDTTYKQIKEMKG